MFYNLRIKQVLFICFLAAVALLLYAAIGRKKNSFAHAVEVEVRAFKDGKKLISESDVRQTLLRSFGNTLEGTELGRLEIERMERVLEEDPFVLDAEAYVDQQNTIHIKIDQREPVIRILDNNGGNYYLDQDAVKMPPSKNYSARVIVATGNIAPYTLDFLKKKKNTLHDLYTLTQTILEDEFLTAFVQQIHVTNSDDFILIPLIGDQEIILGSVKKLDDKLNRLKIFYQEGMPYTGWNKYRSINLKYSGQVVCKR